MRLFDPLLHLPAELTIVGLPAGSEIRVFVESSAGGDVIRSLSVPAGQGVVDDETGVRLAPPQRLDSLQGGAGGIFVSHPTLGGGTGTVALVGGEVNATTFDWRTMDGMPSVQARYEAWQGARLRASRSGNTRTVVSAIATGLALGTGGLVMAMAARKDVDATTFQQETIRVSDDLPVTERAAYTAPRQIEWQNMMAERNAGLVSGGIILGVGVAGVGLTITSEVATRRAVVGVGPWDPESAD